MPSRIISALIAVSTLAGAQVAVQPDPAAAEFVGFAKTWCISCHSGAEPDGGMNLDPALVGPILRNPSRLARIGGRLSVRDMPPPESQQPPDAARARAVTLIETLRRSAEVDAAVSGSASRPAPSRLRRMSRVEYDNTVRDLLHVATRALMTFPADDLGYGFDNCGAVLTTSPLLFEKLVAEGERLAAEAISAEDPKHPPARRYRAETMHSELKPSMREGRFRSLYSNGSVTSKVTLPRDGDYLVHARAFADQAGTEVARMAVVADAAEVATLDVAATSTAPADVGSRVHLRGGPHELGVAFINDYWNPTAKDPKDRDRNLYVDWVEISGPLDERPRSAAQVEIFAGDKPAAAPHDRAVLVLRPFLERAFRRPPTDSELLAFAKIVEGSVAAGQRFEQGVQTAIAAALVAPAFLYREGLPGSDNDRFGGLWARASRLSYFLWSSMPDARLFELARTGALADSTVLRREIRRMLDDARGSALARNFAAQWLELRNVNELAPDPAQFAEFDEDLRTAMREETELFVEAVRREKRPLRELLEADFTFVNERLARHYGIAGIHGPSFQRVHLDDPRRRGLLGHASILAVTSNPTRTSPVKRGKWILEGVLDAPPPPPPPGVGALDEGAAAKPGLTLRQRMDVHRRNPSCASCHTTMDALGFALENFDPVGRWRDADGGAAIDARGATQDGHRFAGAEGLRDYLVESQALTRCVTKKLATFATGTPPEGLALERLMARVGDLPKDVTLDDLVMLVAFEDGFRLAE